MTRRRAAPLAAVLLAAALALGLIAAPAQAALRHIDGTVVSKNSADRSFRVTTQSGSQVRIKVSGTTAFERIAGFGALHKGMKIQVEAQQTSSGLVAKKVEPQGGNGGGGGSGGGGGGADDGPNHT
jgi:hypothetical protein